MLPTCWSRRPGCLSTRRDAFCNFAILHGELRNSLDPRSSQRRDILRKMTPRKWALVAALYAMLGGSPALTDASSASPVSSSVVPFFFYSKTLAEDGAVVSSFASLLSPGEQKAVELDRAWVWQRYCAHLMSTKRASPFVVFFTDDSGDCTPPENDDDEERDPAADSWVADCLQRRAHTDTVYNAVKDALATSFPPPALVPVVHIPMSQLPQAFEMHHVPASPSLMWFPPRSTGKFQRFAHPQTNFLDLSSPELAASDAISSAISSFLRRAYAQNGLFFPPPGASPRSTVVPALETEMSTAESLFNMLPFAAIGLYILLQAFDHREFVLKVLCSRFTWLILTQGVVYIALSGIFHSIIHHVQFFYFHPQHGLYLIHPSGRKQFFLEGLFNGAWSFLISFALFSVTNVMPKVRTQYARDEIFRIALLVVGVSYMFLHLLFMSKHPWLSR